MLFSLDLRIFFGVFTIKRVYQMYHTFCNLKYRALRNTIT